MDEASLVSAVELYKQQFLQVQNVLQATGEEGQEDIVKIRDDLVELIHVSEESLLSLKKSLLLKLLDEQGASGSSTQNNVDGQNVSEAENHHTDTIEEEDIIGTKCRVSYTQEWGVAEHHNAMVFSVEEFSSDGDPDKAKVRVLFLNPTHKSMVPCPYFLDGKCRFNQDECRYSHGFLVNVEDLKPFREPDFSDIEEGQQCLARYSDGVWYKSTIKSIKHDHHEFVVHYDTYNSDATLGLDSVFPFDKKDSPNFSDKDLSSLSSDDEDIRLVMNDDKDGEELSYEWKPTGISIGDWEQHTRGIGSKLMVKMGYIFGKGLGSDGCGRVEPIEVTVLPQGKSLDVCAELRERKKLKEPFKKKKKNPAIKSQKYPTKQGTINDVFVFLNHKFGGNKGNIQEVKKSSASVTSGDQFDIKDRKKRKTPHDDMNTNWNIKLFKIHEEIAAAEKQLNKQKQAHGRQTSMDTGASSFFKKKVDSMEQHITQLRSEENLIKQKMHRKTQHKKLTIF